VDREQVLSPIERPFEARNVLRVVVLMNLLIFVLAGCGAASMEDRSGGNENRDSSGDPEKKKNLWCQV
jgi:hypothetical protein